MGGIGSGKTTVAKHFESKGFPVYFADDRAKIITNTPEIISLIKAHFGETVFENDVLDRKKLGKIVFRNKNKLELLNNIIHPAVKLDFKNWLAEHEEFEFVFKESAILLQTSFASNYHKIIVVHASNEDRIARILLRDNISKKEISYRMKNQPSYNEYLNEASNMIFNEDLKSTIKQANNFLKSLKIK